MNTLKALFAALSIALAAPTLVHAQTDASTAATQPLSTGIVKKVDIDQKKLTIKHGPLTNLGMPGMTMVFHVADPAMVDQVKEGDDIRFVAEKKDGALTVTHLEKAK